MHVQAEVAFMNVHVAHSAVFLSPRGQIERPRPRTAMARGSFNLSVWVLPHLFDISESSHEPVMTLEDKRRSANPFDELQEEAIGQM